MKSVTESCVISQPKDLVFDFLSNSDNLSKWSTQFVKELRVIGDKKKAVTPLGEVYIRIDADKKSGIIDIFAGPDEDNMSPAFMRVIPFSDNSCGVTFTFFKWPQTTDQMWEMFCDWIKIEVGNIKKLFS